MQTTSKLAALLVTMVAVGALVAAPPASASGLHRDGSAAVDSVTTTFGDSTDTFHDL
jgi:hypothetical protein